MRPLIIFWAAFVFGAGGWIGFVAGQANAHAAVRVVDDGCIGISPTWHVAGTVKP